MELTKKQRALKYISFCLIILLADLLQNVDGLFLQIGNARCFLLLPVAVIFAMGEDFLGATLLGLFGGMLWDLTASVHLGFNCIFFALICFGVSALVTYIARNTFVTGIIAISAAVLLYCLTYWLCFIIIKGVNGGEGTIFSFYLPSAVYTVAISPVIWILLNPVKKKFKQNY